MARNGITTGPVTLLIGTRKGAFFLKSDLSRQKWSLRGPQYLGHIVNHIVMDPRDRKTLVMAARTGHLGPTVYYSKDFGKTWKEASKPPQFKKAKNGLSVGHVFWLTPGHADEKDTWYAGTSPQGLFRSRDGGKTWEGIDGFNENPMRRKWIGDEQGIPDGPTLHSILIDPRDPKHMYLGMSIGGFFESFDRGKSWGTVEQGLCGRFYSGSTSRVWT